MSKMVVVSAKVPKEVKEELKKQNVNISKLVREALENEIKKRRVEALKRRYSEIKPILDKISAQEVTQLIRKDREQR